jgi:hypothetical protein
MQLVIKLGSSVIIRGPHFIFSKILKGGKTSKILLWYAYHLCFVADFYQRKLIPATFYDESPESRRRRKIDL